MTDSSNTNDRVGYCLDVLDLFLSKAVAGREKDRKFCMALLEYGDVTQAQALEIAPTMPIDSHAQRKLRATIQRWAKALQESGKSTLQE